MEASAYYSRRCSNYFVLFPVLQAMPNAMHSTKENNSILGNLPRWVGRIAMFLYAIIVASFVFFLFLLWGNWTLESDFWGNMGDFLGGTAGMAATVLALIYLVASLRKQQEALEEQQREISLTKKMQERQQFLEMFSRHLTFLREVVNQISDRDTRGGFKTGIDCLGMYCDRINRNGAQETILMQFFDDKPKVSYYFRNLYKLLKWFYLLRQQHDHEGETSGAPEDEKRMPGFLHGDFGDISLGILEAQLSDPEKMLLYFYAKAKHGGNSMMRYLSPAFCDKAEKICEQKEKHLPLKVFKRDLDKAGGKIAAIE